MTSSHIFFIPGMIMIGMFVGFILGSRAVRNQMELQRRRDDDREAARAARAAKREAAPPKAEVEAKPEAEVKSAPEPETKLVSEDGPETKPGKRKGKKS